MNVIKAETVTVIINDNDWGESSKTKDDCLCSLDKWIFTWEKVQEAAQLLSSASPPSDEGVCVHWTYIATVGFFQWLVIILKISVTVD